MKQIRTSLIAAGLVLATSAFAQMGSGMGPGMGQGAGNATPQARTEMREHMREHMADRHAKRLGELKAKLKLDAGQEGAWKTFADSMQPPATAQAHPDRAAMAKLSTPERIDQMQALHAQREAEMKKRGDATKTFYAGLNAEQKKTFDAETARFMQQGMGTRHQRHPH